MTRFLDLFDKLFPTVILVVIVVMAALFVRVMSKGKWVSHKDYIDSLHNKYVVCDGGFEAHHVMTRTSAAGVRISYRDGKEIFITRGCLIDTEKEK